MCNNCEQDNFLTDITLTDAERSITLCPACIEKMLRNGKLNFTPDYKSACEITGAPGAVHYDSAGEQYTLNPETMHRLLNHSLRISEYRTLIKTRPRIPYELDTIFYSANGAHIIQPGITNIMLRKIYNE